MLALLRSSGRSKGLDCARRRPLCQQNFHYPHVFCAFLNGPGHTTAKASSHALSRPSWDASIEFAETKRGAHPDHNPLPPKGRRRRLSALERGQEKAKRKFGAWSPEACELRDSFASGAANPAETLLQKIQIGKADLEIIRLCLFAARQSVLAKPWRDRPAKISELLSRHPCGFIRPVLDYIIQDPRIWIPLFFHDQPASQGLCYLAVAEGCEGVIQDWIRSNIALQTSDFPEIEEGSEHWRVLLFNDLFIGFAVYDSTTDRALQGFLELIRWKHAVIESRHAVSLGPNHFVKHFSFKTIVASIVGTICSNSFEHTDADSFERFQQYYIQNDTSPEPVKALNVCRLAMRHPRPDPTPFMTWMRERGHENVTKGMRPKLLNPIGHSMRLCYRLLKQQQNDEDARWLAEQYGKIFTFEINTPAKRGVPLQRI